MSAAPEPEVRSVFRPTSDPATFRSLGHVEGFDGIRGVSILLVVFVHLRLIEYGGPTHVKLFDSFFEGGFLGVDLFMVLSGFLITAVLLREHISTGRVLLRSFYRRRAVRLLPALAALLIAHAVYATISRYSPAVTSNPLAANWEIIANEVHLIFFTAIYISNFYLKFRALAYPPDMGHLWSLAVEEQFYLLWPVLLVALVQVRSGLRFAKWLLVVAIVAVSVRRITLFGQVNWVELSVRTDTRVDPLLLGALLALLWSQHRTPTRHLNKAAWFAVAVMAVTVYGAAADTEGATWMGSVFSIGAAVLVLATVEQQWTALRVLRNGVLDRLGKISYGLYLWHPPIFVFMGREASTMPTFPRIVLAIALSLGISLLSYHLLERPLQRRFRRQRA